MRVLSYIRRTFSWWDWLLLVCVVLIWSPVPPLVQAIALIPLWVNLLGQCICVVWVIYCKRRYG